MANRELISAGQLASTAALAREDNAALRNPPEEVTEEQIKKSNALRFDDDLVASKRLTEQLDAERGGPYDENGALVIGIVGADTAPTDDSGSAAAGSSPTAPQGSQTESVITPRPNVLHRFSSMTYNFSLYLLTPEQHKKLIATKKKDLQGYQLLIQSGGIPSNQGVSIPVRNNAALNGAIGGGERDTTPYKRNPNFGFDFYIDDVVVKSLIGLNATGSAHNSYELEFKVFEPYGYTFIDRLRAASNQFTRTSQYQSQIYLLDIKFYGYDEFGNRIQATDVPNSDTTTSDPFAIAEKFIPFFFTNIKFRIGNQGVEYDCQALPLHHAVGFGTRKGTIKFNVELRGQTLGEVLNGSTDVKAQRSNQSVNGAITTTTSTDTKILTKGLAQALNDEQEKLCSGADAQFTYPDRYFFAEAPGSDFFSKKILFPNSSNKGELSRTPMDESTKTDKLSSAKGNAYHSQRLITFNAGKQLVQQLEELVRNSTYITDQGKFEVDEKTQKLKLKENAPAGPVKWFKIIPSVVAREYDPRRGDYAYDITFTLVPYVITNMHSPYFNKTLFNGVHKKYEYYFTGRNTDILTFEQNYNYQYYIPYTLPTKGQALTTEDLQEVVVREPEKASSNSRQSSRLATGEAAAQMASVLYSIVDQATLEMMILGDPDYISSADLFYANQWEDSYFVTDGSINTDKSETLIEVVFKTARDLDLDRGVLETEKIDFNQTSSNPQAQIQGLIYRITEVQSNFSKGQFTQTVKGMLNMFNEGPAAEEYRELAAAEEPTTPGQRQLITNVDPQIGSQPAADQPTTSVLGSTVPGIGGAVNTQGTGVTQSDSTRFDFGSVGQRTAISAPGSSPAGSVGFDFNTIGR